MTSGVRHWIDVDVLEHDHRSTAEEDVVRPKPIREHLELRGPRGRQIVDVDRQRASIG
jgi:hypothetical protein